MRYVWLLVVLCACDRVFDVHEFSRWDARSPDAIEPDGPSGPADGLIAHYKMDTVGLAISCMTDATGRGHDGSCLLGLPTLVPGIKGNGFHFDGMVQIHVHDAPELEPPIFTLAFWLELDSLAFGCPVNRVYGDSDNSWQVCLDNNIEYLVGSQHYAPGPGFAAAEWHHVAVTFDGTTFAAWLDGTYQLGGTTTVSYDNQDIVLGTDLDSGVPSAPYTGAIDELRLYNRVLTAAEIMALVQAP